MTEEQSMKMELLKSHYRERLRPFTDLIRDLRARQFSISEGLGPAIDKLYEQIENERIRNFGFEDLTDPGTREQIRRGEPGNCT